MRILVTNDDGVLAPGIAALARAAAGTGHEVIVVAPLDDCSGAGAAVGAFYRRDGVEYETATIAGIEDVPTYGVDAPPALCVILACVGGFGPLPDLVLSGINHGANLGRAALHSGTIGAALTAAHFGVRAVAASIRFGPDPVPWETPAMLAVGLVEVVAQCPPATVLNLNTPDVALHELRGVRRAALGRSGTIRQVRHDDPATAGQLPPSPGGVLRLDLGIPGSADDALDDPSDGDPDTALIASGCATVTALRGVAEAAGVEAADAAGMALRSLLRATASPFEVERVPKVDGASALRTAAPKEIPS